MTTVNPEDLSELERVLLGVLGAGLAPSSVAGDPTFRIDHLTAVGLALLRGLSRQTFLNPAGPGATDAFQRALTEALHALEDRKILGVGSPPPDMVLTIDNQPAARIPRAEVANFDQQPKVFDRYLAGRCLDELLNHPDVYRFIMDKYGESSEVWQRVYKQYL